jgi:aminoglycoside phosphotransferase (APT) family kinase protein
MSTDRMHPDMHPIDEDLVRRLIAGQFPQWAGLAVRRFPSGGTVNAMYRLGEELVVRLPLVPGGAGDVSLERTWLPRLAPHLPTRIPSVLAAGHPAEGYPWPWSVYQARHVIRTVLAEA